MKNVQTRVEKIDAEYTKGMDIVEIVTLGY